MALATQGSEISEVDPQMVGLPIVCVSWLVAPLQEALLHPTCILPAMVICMPLILPSSFTHLKFKAPACPPAALGTGHLPSAPHACHSMYAAKRQRPPTHALGSCSTTCSSVSPSPPSPCCALTHLHVAHLCRVQVPSIIGKGKLSVLKWVAGEAELRMYDSMRN